MPGDSFTEVTSRSWFGRMGESIKGVIVGLVLFVLVMCVGTTNVVLALRNAL